MADKGGEKKIQDVSEDYGLNEKQKLFCELYLKNGSAGLSYKKAYGDSQGKELAMGSCYTNGSRLLKKDNVQNYLNVLRTRVEPEKIMAMEEVLLELVNLSKDYATKNSDKIKCLELIGKWHGGWQEKLNVSNDMQIEINLTGEMEQEATGEIIEVEIEQKLEDTGK